ncbi:MAG: carboxypeptidase regulatory-like domain-containing protein [Alcaligenaceae bacterium]|nr:carboxypeptidase regulatory-like domain-containing protein [Alcaligenaceae bacterium]
MLKIKNLKILSLAIVLLLAACSSSPKQGTIDHGGRKDVARVAFNPSDIKQSSARSQLVGRAYISDYKSYGERTGALIDVILNPVSKTSTQWYEEVCRRGNVLTGPINSAYRSKIRTVKTNQYGQFVFSDVPRGEYYLSARMYWLDTQPITGPVQYGGLVAKKISLKDSIETIDLNDSARCQSYFH